MLNLNDRRLYLAVGLVAVLVAGGLLAASFVLTAGGGDPEQARENVTRAVEEAEEESRPAAVWAGPLRLPTGNVAIFEEGGGPGYYQHTNRWRDGKNLRPWQAGQYGFVRTPVVGADGDTVYTRFHEGIDAKPLRRDAAGEPLDTVRAVAGGQVAYVNAAPAASNYGRYIVVEHEWEGSPYYSLYAHLSQDLFAQSGERVRQGAPLARMGYTGAGLDRERAHLHFELNLLLSDHFQRWITKHFGGNPHGIYSGLNLRGFDPASYFEALRESPGLTVPQFLSREEPYYKVAFPARGPLDLLRRYPWMREGSGEGATTDAPAWEMSFARSGFPLRVRPYREQVGTPTVTQEPPAEKGRSCMNLTYEHLQGRTPDCTLAPRGQRYIDLIMMQAAG